MGTRAGRASPAKKPKAPVKPNTRSRKAPADSKAPSTRKPPEPGAAVKPTPGQGSNLNPKQRAFVAEYLKDKNATQAAIRAGYSKATAKQIGSRLLTNVDVSTACQQGEAQLIAQVTHETGITLQRTLEYIARGAFHDPRKFFKPNGELVPITDLDDITAAALAGFEVTEIGGRGEDAVVRFISKAKLADRKGYLDMLMKHLGGYGKDNEQAGTPLGEAMRGFLDSLHQSGAARLPMVPRK